MRALPLAVLCVTVGCGPEFAVMPRGGQPSATATAPTGPSLTAFANQWDGEPYDLADYVTPIAVELYNPGPYDVRISLADFALRDERGTRFPAINPFLPAVVGQIQPRQLPKPVLLAGAHIGPPGGSRGGFGGFRGGGGFHGGRGFIGAPARRFGSSIVGPSWGYRPGGWPGFYLYGGLRGYYGAGSLYWNSAFLYPPGYGTWVFWWGPGFYPSPRPSSDVLAAALPEGVLAPGGRVHGFLYFKKATSRETQALNLTWEVTDGRTGAPLGSTNLPLEVVRSQ